MKNQVIRDRQKLVPNKQYELGELPDNVHFYFGVDLYRTATFPKHYIIGLNGKSRPCFCLSSGQMKELRNDQTVLIF